MKRHFWLAFLFYFSAAFYWAFAFVEDSPTAYILERAEEAAIEKYNGSVESVIDTLEKELTLPPMRVTTEKLKGTGGRDQLTVTVAVTGFILPNRQSGRIVFRILYGLEE